MHIWRDIALSIAADLLVVLALTMVFASAGRAGLRADALTLQGSKLTASDEIDDGGFGVSVALSADGNLAVIGGHGDHSGVGAAWIFIRAAGVWSQSAKLTAKDEVGNANFGSSVALSADGTTVLIGGPYDQFRAGNTGAAWVFTRSGRVWKQQGPKLIGPGEVGAGDFGSSVALSADGNTALVGGFADNTYQGATWVYTRSSGVWQLQGSKLTATGEIGGGDFGRSVALSADGNTALIGGDGDNGATGAAWTFTRSGAGVWGQQAKLTAANPTAADAYFGSSVALSDDGNTALIGGPGATGAPGAAWAFTRSGVGTWTQQGAQLTGGGETGAGRFGQSVALGADGNSALIGGPTDVPVSYPPIAGVGAAWMFGRSSAGAWSQQGPKLTGTGESGNGIFGQSVALSSDGATALVGGFGDNNYVGAAWVFLTQPAITSVKPTTGPTAGGTKVTITGSGFGAAAAVRFGQRAAVSFKADSPTQITATSPAATAGTVDVTVTTPGGTSPTVRADRFTYFAPPRIKPGFSFTGVARSKAKLRFTVLADPNATALKTIMLRLPAGVTFSPTKRSIGNGITLSGSGGTRLGSTMKVSRGVLTIVLNRASRQIQLTIASPAITVTRALAQRVGQRHGASLTIIVDAADTSRRTTRLVLRVKAT